VGDLLTHGAAAVLLKVGVRGRFIPVFVLGTVMPDLCSRVPAIGLGYVHVHLVRVSPFLTHGWQPLHQPIGLVLLAFLTCFLFQETVRSSVFWNLLGGMALHLGLDVLQSHHGAGYLLGFPFSDFAWELGVIGSEATVGWAIPLSLLAWFVYRYRASQP
jgi:hypothetical protein